MNNPDLQRWLLAPDGIATRLRALRGTATGKVFAEAAGMRATKLSKLELAQQEPTADDIRAIVQAAGAPQQLADELVAKLADMPTVRVSARINRFGQAATQKRLNQILAAGGRIQFAEVTYLPRPLQTLAYAKTVLAATAAMQGVKSEAEQAATVLVSAGRYLHDPDRTFNIVIPEPVLHWAVLPPRAMREQLEQLLDAAVLPNVSLGILPAGQPAVVLPPAGFTLIDGKGYADSLEGSSELVDHRLAGHERLMDTLTQAAVHGDAATALIEAAIRSHSSPSVRFNAGIHS